MKRGIGVEMYCVSKLYKAIFQNYDIFRQKLYKFSEF